MEKELRENFINDILKISYLKDNEENRNKINYSIESSLFQCKIKRGKEISLIETPLYKIIQCLLKNQDCKSLKEFSKLIPSSVSDGNAANILRSKALKLIVPFDITPKNKNKNKNKKPILKNKKEIEKIKAKASYLVDDIEVRSITLTDKERVLNLEKAIIELYEENEKVKIINKGLIKKMEIIFNHVHSDHLQPPSKMKLENIN